MLVSCRKTVVGRVFTAKVNANIRSFPALPRVWIPTTSFVAAHGQVGSDDRRRRCGLPSGSRSRSRDSRP
jgi:hypothetical protein